MIGTLGENFKKAAEEAAQILVKLRNKQKEYEDGTLTQTADEIKTEVAMTNSRTIRSANRLSTIDELKRESSDPIYKKINDIISGTLK